MIITEQIPQPHSGSAMSTISFLVVLACVCFGALAQINPEEHSALMDVYDNSVPPFNEDAYPRFAVDER